MNLHTLLSEMPRLPSYLVHRMLAASWEIRKAFYDPKEQISQK